MGVGLLQAFTKEGTFFRGLGTRGVRMEEEGLSRVLAYVQAIFLQSGSGNFQQAKLKKQEKKQKSIAFQVIVS